jgi:tRNA U34 5-methylaminomethyl-2-thiouridine-forming methyltransferase MnmC
MPELIKTADGSSTLYVKELDETYHSRHGALQESMHVFIENGLHYFLSHTNIDNISILEIGFGTGLNALLTFNEAQKNQHIKFVYHTIEAYPIDLKVAEKLDFKHNNKYLLDLHNCEWNVENKLSDNFIFFKHHVTFQNFNTDKKFDIIYYDAFGPRAQPDMWTKETLLKATNYLRKNGILVTYCAKGEVKRIFKNAGFVVETLKGPPGKREMIRVLNN